MRALSIMYHDVVENGNSEASGFPGEGAHIYKLEKEDFGRHMDAIRTAIGEKPIGAVGKGPAEGECPVFLTFDDGGVSAHDLIGGMLERHSWRGHFFVTTDWIGRPGFLNAAQIRELDARGHVIGSHSCSHPTRMSYVSWEQMLHEWHGSTEALRKILGKPVRVASVPGGFYSRRVGEAAARAGIEVLFTSEPTTRVHTVDGCLILGRYMIQQGMTPEFAAGLAAGKAGPRWKQAALWEAKRVAKTLGGSTYLRVRRAMLGARKASGK
ncbi:MAG TPA: polysaccharide deacetylase family protein [Bryobacteraceae bacterium]|nr:polysaccharide deacetylase family protein [Bryobacteraceae bacterium]